MKSDAIFALLRRRGYFWPTAEIYGGAQGLYDYGPLGAALKRRIEEAWATWFLGLSEDYYLIEASEILPEAVVRASGHLENFTDPEVECAACHAAFRADTVLEKSRPEGVDGLSPEEIGRLVAAAGARCPKCGSDRLSVPKPLPLMFRLDFGVQAGERAYLRPETAQSSYLAFDRMFEVGRKALPLGIAVIGKAYRNEIAPRQLLFRMRSFTQAELQIFFDPAAFPVPFGTVSEVPLPVLRVPRREAGEETPELAPARALVAPGGLPEFYVYHLVQTFRFFTEVLGIPPTAVRFYEKSDRERAFYNRIQFDVEVRLESLGGFKEIGAVHYRGDYDLSRHGAGTGKDLQVPTGRGDRVLPHVLEITFGVDRSLWALADLGLAEEGDRTVWRLPAWLAPVQVGAFPLLRKEHGERAREVHERLLDEGIRSEYDAAGTIGKRYARMDEAGAPFCATIDRDTLAPAGPTAGTVTLRERDSKAQERLPVDGVIERVRRATRFPRPRSPTRTGP
ncbi:MAG TPA: glycine--tRNA ligase [Thermoplasmata archaeon]|nr:glycine--tRNA ligase [Thermoplasmata archaeon]